MHRYMPGVGVVQMRLRFGLEIVRLHVLRD